MAKITTYTAWDVSKHDLPTFVKFEKNESTGQVKLIKLEHRPCPYIQMIKDGISKLIFKHDTREEPDYATHH